MIAAALNIAGGLVVLAAIGFWIHALVNWDGVKNCDRQCDQCPFPPDGCSNLKGETKK